MFVSQNKHENFYVSKYYLKFSGWGKEFIKLIKFLYFYL